MDEIFQSPFFIPIISVLLSVLLSFVTALLTVKRRIGYERKLRKRDDHFKDIKLNVLEPLKTAIKMFSEEHNYFRFQDDWIILGILQDNEHKKFWINQTPSSLNRFAKNLEAGHRDDKLFLDIQNHLPDFYRKLVNFGDTIEKIKKFKEDLVNFLEQIYAKWGTKLNDVWTKTAGVHVEAGSPSSHDAFNAFLRATLFKKLDIDEEYWSSTIKFVKKNSELYSTWSLVLSSPEFHEYPDLAKVYKSLKKSIEEMIQDINDLLISQKDLKGKCPFLD